MRTWEMPDAEQRLAEVAELAIGAGPQRITGGARGAVVVLDEAEYRRLAGAEGVDASAPPARERPSLVEFMRNSPLADAFRDGLLPEDIFDQIREQSRAAARYQASVLESGEMTALRRSEP